MLWAPRGADQVVVSQHVHVAHTRLGPDLFEDGGREYFAAKDGGHPFGGDLVDQVGDLLGGRLVERRRLEGTDHREAVVLGEIGVSVVVGDELSLSHRNCLDSRPHRRIERIDLCGECVEVRRIDGGVVRIPTGQHVTDDLGVGLRHRRVGPEVRVGLAALEGEREVIYVVRFGKYLGPEFADHGTVLEVGQCKVLRRFFKDESVDEDDVGLLKYYSVTRLWLEGVGIRSFRDDADDRGVRVACDVGDDARDRRDRRGNRQRTVDDPAEIAADCVGRIRRRR